MELTLRPQDSEAMPAPRPSQTLAHLSSTFQSNTITRATTCRHHPTILCLSSEHHTTTHPPTHTAHSTPTFLQALAMVSQMAVAAPAPALCPLTKPRPPLLSDTRLRLPATTSCHILRPQEQGRPHHRPPSSVTACRPTTMAVDLQP